METETARDDPKDFMRFIGYDGGSAYAWRAKNVYEKEVSYAGSINDSERGGAYVAFCGLLRESV